MILLLSNDGDLSCDLVQDWLDYYKYPYMRINSFEFEAKATNVQIKDGKMIFQLAGKFLDANQIHAVWYRKYGFFRFSETYKRLCHTGKLSEMLISHLCKEFSSFTDLLLYALRAKNWLTSPFHCNLNKIFVLCEAQKIGFSIPRTIVTNSLSDISKEGTYICKSIYDPIITSWGGEHKSMMYTVEISSEDINMLPPHFMPSLVQEKIEKEYEIRSFYIMGEIYSMAIFSQRDKTTQVDFRNYNWKSPNRMVPYTLDDEMSEKLRRLMERLNLNCASIDFIVDKQRKLYFLEVNPTGQFGMVDFPCNYGLHKIVADKLIYLDNN